MSKSQKYRVSESQSVKVSKQKQKNNKNTQKNKDKECYCVKGKTRVQEITVSKMQSVRHSKGSILKKRGMRTWLKKY